MATNPYLNRLMIRNSRDFYGRRREVARLYARVAASPPQSVSVTGERRIGKSSLLWFLAQPENTARQLPNPDQLIFIFLDFQENQDMNIEDFCAALLRPLKDRLASSNITSDNSYDALLKSVQQLDAQGLKLAVLLDEFETVTQNPNFNARFYAFLRSLANRYNVAYITASRRPLQYFCHTKEIANSPFFNIFSSLHLSGLTLEEALELITAPSKAAGIPLESYADFLLEVGGTYPFFLQVACSMLFEYLQTGGALDTSGREAVCQSILEEVEPHFHYILERMAESEQRVCRRIIEGQGLGLPERTTLRSLIQQGYVLESPEGPRLFSSLFAEFIRESQPQPRPQQPQDQYTPEAIVVIDICGSTHISNLYGAHRLRALYEELEGISFEVANRFRDRYRRSTGDGLLFTFNTVLGAVNTSLEIQRRVQEHNASSEPSHRIPIRFSVHFGETLTDDQGRRYGDAVNMAFKVESLGVERLSEATDRPIPSENYILVTEQVARALASVPGIRCRELGTFELEGLAGLHRVYQLET